MRPSFGLSSRYLSEQPAESINIPYTQAASELNTTIFIHPWDMPVDRMSKYWLPWLVGELQSAEGVVMPRGR